MDYVDEVSASEQSLGPSWELTSEEVIRERDHVLTYDNDKHKLTLKQFEVNVEDGDTQKVMLIAVKSTSKTPLNSTIDVYIAASQIQTLDFGRSHYGIVDNRKDVYKIYEAFIPHLENETYVVELTPCYGKAELLISRHFPNLLAGKRTITNSQLVNGRIHSVIENNRKTARKYIIAVKSLNSTLPG